MQNAFIVVWRESLEALLIIGILYAWLSANDPKGKGKRALAAGIAVGVGLALLLGWALMSAQSGLVGDAQEFFQIAMLCVAALLITQVVFWMSMHGRAMKANLENRIEAAHSQSGYYGVIVVAALAIAREGSETVIFLYSASGTIQEVLLGAVGGFAAAILTAWAAAKSLGRLNIGLLLKISSILLLVLASSLLVTASDHAINLEWLLERVDDDTLVRITDAVWDSSGLVDDGEGVGKVLADFAGYRARPILPNLLAWGGYWLLAASLYFFWIRRRGK
ncbi:MAG: FTR1 family protein [Zoogloeaceae bacterium]|jgi:high-affinity iron transporter|nr:FTR1 family protein [Zoogloeaceae bacterium]